MLVTHAPVAVSFIRAPVQNDTALLKLADSLINPSLHFGIRNDMFHPLAIHSIATVSMLLQTKTTSAFLYQILIYIGVCQDNAVCYHSWPQPTRGTIPLIRTRSGHSIGLVIGSRFYSIHQQCTPTKPGYLWVV